MCRAACTGRFARTPRARAGPAETHTPRSPRVDPQHRFAAERPVRSWSSLHHETGIARHMRRTDRGQVRLRAARCLRPGLTQLQDAFEVVWWTPVRSARNLQAIGIANRANDVWCHHDHQLGFVALKTVRPE